MLCSRLIQTSPAASWIHKHSLRSYGRHTAARQSNLVIDWLLGATDQDRRNLSTFLSFQCVFFGLIFPGSAKADIKWAGTSNGYSIASCARNMYAKNYWNLIIMLQVTVIMSGMFFHVFCLFQCIFRLVFFPEVVQKQTFGEVKNWTVI